jgi:hypothetical protein
MSVNVGIRVAFAARLAGYKGNDKQLAVIAAQNLIKPRVA